VSFSQVFLVGCFLSKNKNMNYKPLIPFSALGLALVVLIGSNASITVSYIDSQISASELGAISSQNLKSLHNGKVLGLTTSGDDPSSVLILVDDNTPPEAGSNNKSPSVFLGEYYAQKRGIPFSNIVHLQISNINPAGWDSWHINWPDYDAKIRQPVLKYLTANNLTNKINYIVTTYGIPSHLNNTPYDLSNVDDGISVDSVLSDINATSAQGLSYVGSLNNPYYTNSATGAIPHFRDFKNPLGWKMYLVTRLDGPGLSAAMSLVDRAVTAEPLVKPTDGVGYFDYRGLNCPSDPYCLGDNSILNAYKLSNAFGTPSILNNNHNSSSAMIHSAPSALWVWGWYSGVNTWEGYQFVPGAMGAMFTSYTANFIRRDGTGSWTPIFIRDGITATWGATSEPGLYGYTLGDVLLNHFWTGYNFAESAYMATPFLNGTMVFLGDPLYAPKAFQPGNITPTPTPTPNSTPTPTPVVITNTLPVGNFDGLKPDVKTVYGWSYDPDVSAQSINVNIYADGPAGSGTLLASIAANVARPDVNTAFNISGNHGFEFTLPVSYQDGQTHSYYVYGIDALNSNLTALIGSSPQSFTVAKPSQAVVINLNPAPTPGNFTGSVDVNFSNLPSGINVYYTLDGSTPNQQKFVYSGPIHLTQSGWVRASVWQNSVQVGFGEWFYNITQAVPAARQISFSVQPPKGSYSGFVDVTFTNLPSGTTVYYTLDGSTPTQQTTVYTNPIHLTQNGWVRATAWQSGVQVGSGEWYYTVAPVQINLNVMPGPGMLTAPIDVSFVNLPSGTTVYYTLDGSTPNQQQTVYSAPIHLTQSGWVRASAWQNGVQVGSGEWYYNLH